MFNLCSLIPKTTRLRGTITRIRATELQHFKEVHRNRFKQSLIEVVLFNINKNV